MVPPRYLSICPLCFPKFNQNVPNTTGNPVYYKMNICEICELSMDQINAEFDQLGYLDESDLES